jgi:nucleoside-diphosphate-sugar epimerase
MALKILVTGLSGLIGGAFRDALAGEHELTAFNRSEVEGVASVKADLSDREALKRAVEGQDVVIHLAAKAGENFSWEELRDTNVEGTRNVFAAATAADVPRVVFASSGATVAGHEFDEPYKALVEGRYDEVPDDWPLIGVDQPTRPRGVYGSTKVWGEALARHFADTTQTAFINIRIGYVNAEDRPVGPRQQSVWCSQRDVVNAIRLAALENIDENYATFFAGSDNRYNYRDLGHGETLLGFVPQDAA